MPSEQQFDQKHLQDVVLAQSAQIPAARRFTPAVLARAALAAIAIAAFGALFLGVKDYVQQPQKAMQPASTSASASSDSKAKTHLKKTGLVRDRRSQMSAGDARAAGDLQTAANDADKPIIWEEVGNAGGKGMAAMGAGENTAGSDLASDEVAAATHTNGMLNDDTTASGSSSCLPLPNGTQPGDVDAAYYFGWSGEYCGRNTLSSHPAVPGAQQPKY